jgi:sulfocyanin
MVFSGSDDGHLYSFDATNGNILWQANLGLGFGAAPIAYAVNGTEYIAVAAGGTGAGAFIGDGEKTGGTLVVFKLGGSAVHTLPTTTGGSVVNAAQRPSVVGMTKINPWMYMDAKRQHVVINLVAAATADNNGFNYDGYANGKGTFTIPLGWTVDWIFSNAGAIPHSAAMIATLKPGAPAVIVGQAPIETANATQGIGPKQEQYVSFNAIDAGKYYLACLVPGHIQSGMWDYFVVSKSATMPSIS